MKGVELAGGAFAEVSMEGGAGCPVGYKKSSSKKRGHACVKCTKRSASGKCVGKRVYSGTKGSAKKRSTRKRSTTKRSTSSGRCPSGSHRGEDGKCHAHMNVMYGSRRFKATPAKPGFYTPKHKSLAEEMAKLSEAERKAKFYTPGGKRKLYTPGYFTPGGTRRMSPGGKNLYYA